MKRPRKIGKLRAAFRDWLGIPITAMDTEAWQGLLEQQKAGQTVNDQTVLTLSAVWACVRLISQAFSMCPMSMMEQTPQGKRRAVDHWLHGLVHVQPNPWAAASTFWESVIASMLLRGAARIERMMVGNRIVGLRFLAPNRLTIKRAPRGGYIFRYLEADGRSREIPESRIWTIPGFSLDGQHGISAIRYGAAVFGTGLAADGAAASTFEKGLMPTVAFTYPKTLQPEQREDAREAIKRLAGGINAGNPVILENETTAHEIGINPDDAQLLESRKFSIEEVCRWFGVDPAMVGHGEKVSNWGTGLEQKLIGFLTFALGPIIRKVEQSISMGLLSPGERLRFYAKANIEGLLRADSAGRAAFYGVMVDKGIRTRDEIRELEDAEPMGGNAARLTVQSAMTLLDTLGNTSPEQQARAALIEWLREADEPAKQQENSNAQA